MDKGFRIVEKIRGKEPMLRHVICEARYSDGQLYLDHCGRLLKKLLREMPDWVLTPEPTTRGTNLHNLLTGTRLVFALESASLSLDRSSTDEVIDAEEVTEFIRQLEDVVGLVLDELEVTEFTRVGYREYHHFAFDSKEEAEKWLQELGLVTVSAGLYEVFKATPEAIGVAIVLQGENCRYRIGLNGVERPAQIPAGDTILSVRASATHERQRQALLKALKQERQRQINSAFAVVLDVDAYLLNPAEPGVSAFAREQSEAILPLFKKALATQQPKKGK
jgi:hypothetical protein